jgi:hypothetical protein
MAERHTAITKKNNEDIGLSVKIIQYVGQVRISVV